jgi:hypothetical protein
MREELSPLRMSLSLRAERSNLHPDRTAMEIAAHALRLDPRVASLLAMTDKPDLSAFTRLP